MSNLFESLRKAQLIKEEEFPLSPAHNTDTWQELISDQAKAAEAPVPDTPVLRRSIQLRLSSATPILPFDDRHQAASEQYRMIRTKILHHRLQPRTLVVSSADSGDGKTVTAINIAASFALKAHTRVVLVDADMRRPKVASYLGVDDTPGLAEILHGTTTIDQAALYPEEMPNLCIVPAGGKHRLQTELLDSSQWRQFISSLRDKFEYVVFDAPPVGTLADYELVQMVCDGVVFVARPDHTKRAACLNGIEGIPKEKLIGVVLNCVEPWFLWRTHSYGYYAYK